MVIDFNLVNVVHNPKQNVALYTLIGVPKSNAWLKPFKITVRSYTVA